MRVIALSPSGMRCEPFEKRVNNTTVKLQQGDLTVLPVDAWVFYAREDLAIGSGYGTAVTSRGGVAVKKELDTVGSIQMGEAVITGAGEMTAKHIIHACGPKFQEPDIEQKLRACMNASLRVAEEHGIRTLAYPPMGTGFYGVPVELSAKVMIKAITSWAPKALSLEEVVICVIDHRDYLPFRAELERV